MMGNRPYPSRPTGKDLSLNRDKLLADYRRSSLGLLRTTQEFQTTDTALSAASVLSPEKRAA
jgi:hypothetical protein